MNALSNFKSPVYIALLGISLWGCRRPVADPAVISPDGESSQVAVAVGADGARRDIPPEAGSSHRMIGFPEAGSVIGNWVPEAGSTTSPRRWPEAGSTVRSFPRGHWPEPRPLRQPPSSPSTGIVREVAPDPSQAMVELSTILAMRERHQQQGSTGASPPPLQAEANLARQNLERLGIDVTVEEFRGEPLIELRFDERWSRRERTEENFTEVVDAAKSLGLPVGITFYGIQGSDIHVDNLELGQLPSIPNVRRLRFDCCEVDDDAWSLLPKFEQLQSLTVASSTLWDEQAEIIVSHPTINALKLANPRGRVSLEMILKLVTKPELKELTVGLPGVVKNQDAVEFWMSAARNKNWEVLSVDGFQSPSAAVSVFLLSRKSSPLREFHCGSGAIEGMTISTFRELPLLESMTISVADDQYSTEQLIQTLSTFCPQMRRLSLLKTGMPIQGAGIHQILVALSKFSALEAVRLPIEIEDSGQLRPLTRLSQLRSIQFNGLKLDRDLIGILACFPELESLDVDELAFGEESAHLFPWLRNVGSVFIQNGRTLTQDRLQLLTTMPTLKEINWHGGSSLIRDNDFLHTYGISLQSYD
ncbi:MAG: hypothetical protein KDA80_21435 [Planctomycetaceae bacterium]|nr:hypothetical protein [Planctomycetaceae bacterium]